MKNIPEHLNLLLSQTDSIEINKIVNAIPTSSLNSSVSSLQTLSDSETSNLLKKIVNYTTDLMRLEAIGKGLGVHQFLEILTSIDNDEIAIEKLHPLLVGLTPIIFQQAFLELSQNQYAILKKESIAEPLQHQLTLFIHYFEKLAEEQYNYIAALYDKIGSTPLEELTYTNLDTFEKKIESLQKVLEENLDVVDNLLGITWSTNRLDLISNLNQIRENFYHQLHHRVGHNYTEKHASTGLYLFLQDYLNKTFLIDNEKINDDTSALEGLAQLSVWYIPDYWNVGLLPKIQNFDELELEPSHHSDSERSKHRTELLGEVQNNLNKLKLFQILDLRINKIYSKPMLKEYIKKNGILLN